MTNVALLLYSVLGLAQRTSMTEILLRDDGDLIIRYSKRWTRNGE